MEYLSQILTLIHLLFIHFLFYFFSKVLIIVNAQLPSDEKASSHLISAGQSMSNVALKAAPGVVWLGDTVLKTNPLLAILAPNPISDIIGAYTTQTPSLIGGLLEGNSLGRLLSLGAPNSPRDFGKQAVAQGLGLTASFVKNLNILGKDANSVPSFSNKQTKLSPEELSQKVKVDDQRSVLMDVADVGRNLDQFAVKGSRDVAGRAAMTLSGSVFDHMISGGSDRDSFDAAKKFVSESVETFADTLYDGKDFLNKNPKVHKSSNIKEGFLTDIRNSYLVRSEVLKQDLNSS